MLKFFYSEYDDSCLQKGQRGCSGAYSNEIINESE